MESADGDGVPGLQETSTTAASLCAKSEILMLIWQNLNQKPDAVGSQVLPLYQTTPSISTDALNGFENRQKVETSFQIQILLNAGCD